MTVSMSACTSMNQGAPSNDAVVFVVRVGKQEPQPTPVIGRAQSMNVAGIMSGTSADGIDVAIVRIARAPTRTKSARPTLTLLAHEGFPYPTALRRAVLAAMNAPIHLNRRTRPPQLASRPGLRRRSSRHSEEPSHQTRPGRLPRPDALSPGAPRRLRRPHLCLHLATRRTRRDRLGNRRSRCLQLSPRGHVRRRPGRASRVLARLRSLRRSQTWPHPAEHRRHRQSHRHSRRVPRLPR